MDLTILSLVNCLHALWAATTGMQASACLQKYCVRQAQTREWTHAIDFWRENFESEGQTSLVFVGRLVSDCQCAVAKTRACAHVLAQEDEQAL